MSSQNRILVFSLILSLLIHSVPLLGLFENEVAERVRKKEGSFTVGVLFEKKDREQKLKEERPVKKKLLSEPKEIQKEWPKISPLQEEPYYEKKTAYEPPKVTPLLAKESGEEKEPILVPEAEIREQKEGVAYAAVKRPVDGITGEGKIGEQKKDGIYTGLVDFQGSHGSISFKQLDGEFGPSIKKLVKPRYPEFARRLGKEGLVILRVLIDKDGKVRDVKIIKSAGYGFDEEARKAISQSLFYPARENGALVDCLVDIPVRFLLKDN